MAEQTTKYHFILTVQNPTAGGGMAANTYDGTVNVPVGSTRSAAFAWIKAENERAHPDMAGGIVLFFSLEPDAL